MFDDYFITLRADLLEIMNESNEIKDEKLKLEFENYMNKFILIENIIYFMKLNNKNELEEEMIYFGLNEFNKLFSENIKNIYKFHPLNDSEDSKTFWNNKKFHQNLALI